MSLNEFKVVLAVKDEGELHCKLVDTKEKEDKESARKKITQRCHV